MNGVIVITPDELMRIVTAAVANGVRMGRISDAPTEYVSPAQMADRMAVSRATVHRWLRHGMPSLGRGKSRRINVAAAEAWLRGRPMHTTSDDAAALAARKMAG
jgi:excisionase family DNA binding protein